MTKPPPSSSAAWALVFWVGGVGRQGLKDLCALSLLWLWQQAEGMNQPPGLPSYSRMLSGWILDHGHGIKGGQNHLWERMSRRARGGAKPRGKGCAVPVAEDLCADGSQGPSWSPSKWTLSPHGCSGSPHCPTHELPKRSFCQRCRSGGRDWEEPAHTQRWGPGRLGRGRDPPGCRTSFL